MIKAASLDIEIDLLPLSRVLNSQRIAHKIYEESGQQVIWVESEAQARFVRKAIEQYQTGGFESEWKQLRSSPGYKGYEPFAKGLNWKHQAQLRGKKFLTVYMQAPVTITLVIACTLVALVSQLGANTASVSFLFYPLITADGLGALLGSINSPEIFLRTFAPMFLHFSVLHIVFNLLWLWYFGRQLETVYPSWLFLIVVLFTSFVANTTQYLAIGYNNFGGMSGVVYGLVAYTWVLHTLLPRSGLMLNNTMFGFFLVALVVMEVVASSWIATAAHLGGLISGLVIGTVVAGYYRLNTQVHGH